MTVDREERVFAIISLSDPTSDGRYLTWLSAWRRRCWNEFGIKHVCSIDDIDHLTRALAHFHSVLPRLPVELKDVGRYADADELLSCGWTIDPRTRRDAKKAEKARALAGSDVLFDEHGWRLVRIKDRSAAKWWGKGTKWCTSGRESGEFERYSATGDLIVLLTPKGRFQLHTGSGAFRDAADAVAYPTLALRGAPVDLTAKFEQARSNDR